MFKKKSLKEQDVNQVSVEVKTPPIDTKKVELVQVPGEVEDAQTRFNRLLEEHNLRIDFDVVDGTIPTKLGIIKLEKPTLVVKAFYVSNQ